MKIKFYPFILLVFFFLGYSKSVNGQAVKACDLVTVEQINTILHLNLVYDKTSIINRKGTYECRYTDPKHPGTYIAVGLLSAKIDYGFDLLESDYKSSKQTIAAGGKAGGKFTKFFAFTGGGKNAFYMTGEKSLYSGEAFILKFRKGDNIISFSTENIPLKLAEEKVLEIFKLFSK